MKIIISPAKTLDFESKSPINTFSRFNFAKEAITINKSLKNLNPKEIVDLMSVSDAIANLNYNRNQERNLEKLNTENAKQAIFAFKGDVYIGLDVNTLESDKIDTLQNKLFILSGLYGLLKPLDLIQPYRLEMSTKIAIGKNKNLYQFWKTKITSYLNKELQKDELLVNLASNEYFSVIDLKVLKGKLVTPEFKDYKNGKLKMIAFFAKKARGMMVRFIVESKAETIDDLKLFNYEGYAFDASLSTANKLVFTR